MAPNTLLGLMASLIDLAEDTDDFLEQTAKQLALARSIRCRDAVDELVLAKDSERLLGQLAFASTIQIEAKALISAYYELVVEGNLEQ